MRLEKVKISDIIADENIRSKITKESILGLVSSVKESGILQPILVRVKDGKYDLIAGFRRLAAAKEAGLEEIPCILSDINDEDRIQVQLVENIQREDLNPIDEATALRELLAKHEVEDLALMIGKKKLYIEQKVRLLSLPKIVQEALKLKQIGVGHGIVLSRLNSKQAQTELFKEIIGDRLSVNQAESQLTRYSRRLDNAVFVKTKCKTCIHNGANQKDFFDPDIELKGECMDKDCFGKLVAAYIKERSEVFKKKKIPILTREQAYNEDSGRWHPLSDYDIHEIGQSEINKAFESAENSAVIFSEETGHEQLLIRESLFKVIRKRVNAAKKQAKAVGKSGDSEELVRKERRERKKIMRVDETQRRFLIAELRKRATEEQLNRIVLKILFGTESGNSDSISEFLIRNGIMEKKKKNYEIRYDLPMLLVQCDLKEMKKEIIRIAKDNLEAYDTDYLKAMSEEVKLNMGQFRIDEDYLNKLTKEEMFKLFKELKLKPPDKYDKLSKIDLISWFLSLKRVEVPKELLK